MSTITTEPNPLSKELAPLDNQVVREATPLPVSPGVIHLFVGKKGTGKSTLALNLLKRKSSPYFQAFDNIFLVSPTASRDPKFEELIAEIALDGKFYNDLSDDIIDDIIKRVEEFNEEYVAEQMKDSDEETEIDDPVLGKLPKKPKRKSKKPKIIRQPNNLLILDDCLHLLPKSTQKSSINQIFTTSRHKKLSVWVMTQKYNKLNPLIRTNADLLTIFPTDNKQEFESIENDWSIPRETLQRVYDFATSEPNSFLHISFFGSKPTFYKRFDKINF